MSATHHPHPFPSQALSRLLPCALLCTGVVFLCLGALVTPLLAQEIDPIQALNDEFEQMERDLVSPPTSRKKGALAHGKEVKDPDEDKKKKKKKKPETPGWQPTRYTNRQDLVADAHRWAIEQMGYLDTDKNGRADAFEFYRADYLDCAEHSAAFDDILENMAQHGAIDWDQGMGAEQWRGGNHAANWVPGIGRVDVTPIRVGGGYIASDGTPWYNFDATGYTRYKVGFPDEGEFTPQGYKGPMANTAPGVLVPGTGSLGGGNGGAMSAASGMGFMRALQGLTQGRSGGGGGTPSILNPRPGSSSSKAPSKTPAKTPAKSPTAGKEPSKQPSVDPRKGPASAVTSTPAKVSTTSQRNDAGLSNITVGKTVSTVPQKTTIISGTQTEIHAPEVKGVPSTGTLQRQVSEILNNSTLLKKSDGRTEVQGSVATSDGVAPEKEISGAETASDLGNARPAAWEVPVDAVQSDSVANAKGFF